MNTELNQDLTIQRKFRRASKWYALGVMLIALLVLVGWKWDIPLLLRPLPLTVAVNPLTALVILFLGISLLLLTFPCEGRLYRDIGKLLAILTLVIVLLRLLSILSGYPFIIDLLLYGHKLDTYRDAGTPDRMSLSSCLCLLLFSLSLLFTHMDRVRTRHLSQKLALLAACLALFSAIGYLYRVQEFYGFFRQVPMAAYSSLSFLLMALGIFYARPDWGIMKNIATGMVGSTHARIFIPIAVFLPIVLGLLRLVGYWYGLFSTEFGIAILVFSIILAFIWTVRYTTFQLNSRDIQNRQIAEELIASKDRLLLLVDSIQDYAIYLVDTTGHILSWNIGAEKIKGYIAEEVLELPISIFYTKEDIAKGEPQRNLEMAKAYGHYNSEGWRVRKDGTRFWADIVFTALYDHEGQLNGFAKVTRDRTEHKIAQEQIAHQARLMEDTSDVIISMDPTFHIISWNKAAERLYGFSIREVHGQPINKIISTATCEDRRASITHELQQKGQWKGEITHVHKNGNPVYLLVSVSETRNHLGQLDGFVLVGKDIAERKNAEQQLKKFNEELEDKVRKKTAELVMVFERVSDGFMAFDKMGRITYVNKKAAELNKRDQDGLIGQNFWQLFPTAAVNEFGENFHRSIDTQQNIHFQMYSPSLELWIECFMYPSDDGLSLFFRNISDKRLAEETITRSSEELRQLASHLQNIREEERLAISREIHDELGQQLTGIKMDIAWVAKKYQQPEDPIGQRIAGTLGLLDNTIRIVRRIATELRPSILDDLGLIAAIEWQSQEFQRRSGINSFFQSSLPEFSFEPAIAIGLFRICQESLTNVARHSSAKNVWISLDWIDHQLILRIRDDGKGLNEETSKEKKTLGLLGMKERALMMGGKLLIHNGRERGLILEATVPMKEPTTA